MKPEVIAVTDGITCVRRPSYFTCSYIVKTPVGVVLVDAGMKSDGSDVFHALDELAIAPGDVRSIFITHWHNDHAAGAAALVEASGARVYCTDLEAPFLRRDTASGGLAGFVSDAIPEFGPFVLAKGLLGSAPMRAVEPTACLADGAVVDGFRVIATPGHTDGHAAYLYEAESAMFAGDAFALIDGRLRYMARAVTPDLVSARESMCRLLDVGFTLACPGHREPGPIDVEDRKRFVEGLARDEWPILG